jgi:hypothetical protein
LFSTIVGETIIKISEWYDRFTFIDSVWTTFRDLANIAFIFALLFIGVRVILGLGSSQMRQMLARVIIVGLLINFSLFFTKFIVDASNIVSIQFYSASLNIFNGDSNNFFTGFEKSFGITSAAADAARTGGQANTKITEASWPNAFWLLGLSAFLVTGAFVFAAVGIMFLVRFVVIMFLFILSPLAFVAYAFPGMQSQARRWWSALVENCIWPPVFFLFFYALGLMLQAMQSSLYEYDPNVGFNYQLLAAFMLQFSMLVAFLITSVAVAKQVGAQSSKFLTTNFGNLAFGTAGLALRNTVGRASNAAYDKWRGGNFAATRTGQMVFKGLQAGAKSNYDVRNTAAFQAGAKATGTDYGKGGAGILGTAKGGFAGYSAGIAKQNTEYSKNTLKTAEQRKAFIANLRKKNPISIITGKRQGEISAANTIEKGIKESKDERNKEINRLNKERNEKQKELDELRGKATATDSEKTRIGELQTRIDEIGLEVQDLQTNIVRDDAKNTAKETAQEENSKGGEEKK